MVPSIQFCQSAHGGRLAYSLLGEGPLLVLPPGWISHLGVLWENAGFRRFVGALAQHNTVVWFVGAKRNEQGQILADPSARFAFPVSGRQRGGTFELNASGVNLWFTFGPVPLQRFDLRGTFGPDVRA